MIGKVLGAGGFGIVYKAWDEIADVPVAIKEYYPSGLVTRTPGTGYLYLVAQNRANEFNYGRQRFAAESGGSMRIDSLFGGNPSLLHDVSAFDENGTSYLVMEYLEGETLTKHIEMNGQLAVAEGLSMILAVLGAVRDIHLAEIIHRDISPDNIIICADGTVKLIDFGAASFGKNDKNINIERVMKPGYSPPEQYEPTSRTGVHTDIYAIGATLYYALTGIKPDESTNRKDSDLLATPQSLNPEISKSISDAILKSMAIDYRLRFKSAGEFIKALIEESTVLRPEDDLRKRKFRRIISVAASLLVIFVVATVTYMQVRERIPTLNDASVELWYVLTGDELPDTQRATALERIIGEFSEIYPNVDIHLRGVAVDEYEKEVISAISQRTPVLFDSSNMNREALSDTADLNSVATRMRRDTHFLDGYTRLFSERNQIPTGFVVACTFINTTISEYEENGVGDLTALLASMPVGASRIAVAHGHEANFEAAFGSVPYAAPHEFFADEVGAKFADTSMLRTVQSTFAGRYRLLRIEKPEIPAAFGGMLSIAGGDRNEKAALTRLLEFILSENAQDALHIQVNSGLIPLNRVALETFQDVFYDFSDFFENIEQYVFKPQ